MGETRPRRDRDQHQAYPICTPWSPTIRRGQFLLALIGTYRLQSHQRTTIRSLQMPSVSDRPVKRSIRRNELREIVPLADSTIYEMEQRGEFPRRFALSPRCVVWDLAEVEAWLESRRTRPIPRAKHPDVAQRKFRPVKAQGRAQA